MSFSNRADAGRKLAKALQSYRNLDPIVLALPRGGVPVAAQVAKALRAPLDILLVRKIGVPTQPELAAGAIVDADDPIVVRNQRIIESIGMSDADFNLAAKREMSEIARRRLLYTAGRPHPQIEGRLVIVVDDGIATGATMQAALTGLRLRKPNRLVAAVPVAPPQAIDRLTALADDVVCLETHSDFGAVGQFYEDFRQLDDDDVTTELDASST